jgi:hypothetical protein
MNGTVMMDMVGAHMVCQNLLKFLVEKQSIFSFHRVGASTASRKGLREERAIRAGWPKISIPFENKLSMPLECLSSFSALHTGERNLRASLRPADETPVVRSCTGDTENPDADCSATTRMATDKLDRIFRDAGASPFEIKRKICVLSRKQF